MEYTRVVYQEGNDRERLEWNGTEFVESVEREFEATDSFDIGWETQDGKQVNDSDLFDKLETAYWAYYGVTE